MLSSGRAVGRRLRPRFSRMGGGGAEKGARGGREEESSSLLAAILADGGGRRAALGAWALVRVRGFFVFSGEVARTVAVEGARLENASVENEIGAGCQPR